MDDTILVTGASGFVGAHTGVRLAREGYRVRGVLHRRDPLLTIPGAEWCRPGTISEDTDWSDALHGIDVVVHAAARVHAPEESDKAAFYRVNKEGTLRLAGQASRAGVARFIFLSTVAVHGTGRIGEAINELSPVDPQNHYAESKLQAEQGLLEIARADGMEVVIIRPPLVYGANAPGNFTRLVRLVRTGLPLPLRAVSNRRSMVGIENLADFVTVCVRAGRAGNESFVVADEDALSTAELVSLIATGLGRRPRLFAVPLELLEWGARITGTSGAFEKLCGSFELDTRKARKLLDWISPVSAREGIVRAAKAGTSQLTEGSGR